MKLKEIKNLLSLQTLQKIQDNYSTALGIPFSIRNSEGEALTKLSHPSKLWTLIHDRPLAEANLVSILKIAIEKCNRTSQIIIFERHPDAHAFLAPITSNGKIIAYFVGGLVRYGNPNLDIAERQAELLQVNLDTYLDAYLHLPLFTQERLEASANLIKIIGSTLSSLENKNQRNSEQEERNNQSYHSEKRYKRFFEQANDGIVITDFQDGSIVEINNACAKMLGYNNPGELMGIKIDSFYVYPEDRKKYLNILRTKGSIDQWIAHIYTAQGEEKYFEINATLINEKDNKQLVQSIYRDINPRQHRSL